MLFYFYLALNDNQNATTIEVHKQHKKHTPVCSTQLELSCLLKGKSRRPMSLETVLHKPLIKRSSTRSPLLVASTAALDTSFSILVTDLVTSVLSLQDPNGSVSPLLFVAVTLSSLAFTALPLYFTARSQWATELVDPEDLWNVIASGGAVGVAMSWLVRHALVGFEIIDTIVFLCLFGFVMLLLWCFSGGSRCPDHVDEEDDEQKEEDLLIV